MMPCEVLFRYHLRNAIRIALICSIRWRVGDIGDKI